MRSDGTQLHFGNFHGALKSGFEPQYQYRVLFLRGGLACVDNRLRQHGSKLEENTWSMVIDWLAAGPESGGLPTLFIQSKVPEHR